MSKLSDLRKEYSKESLDIADVKANPFEQFKYWFDECMKAELTEPNAMVISTSVNDIPESRVVLLKELNEKGFVFYTNYLSHKGNQIKQNNQVVLNFLWLELERQVRINGVAEKLDDITNDEYFYSRPKMSQIGAIVSNQSEIIPDRKYLEDKLEKAIQHYESNPIVRPEHWGGYVVKPYKIEFWQGRPSRLHDRLLYTLKDNNQWKIERLSP